MNPFDGLSAIVTPASTPARTASSSARVSSTRSVAHTAASTATTDGKSAISVSPYQCGARNHCWNEVA